MTGTQGMIAFIAGPIIGVLVATLFGQIWVGHILLAALLGEAVVIVTVRVWSRWSMRGASPFGQDRLVAVAADVTLNSRLSALGILALLAVAIGGLALVLLRIVGIRPS